jgi:hypothetical protein
MPAHVKDAAGEEQPNHAGAVILDLPINGENDREENEESDGLEKHTGESHNLVTTFFRSRRNPVFRHVVDGRVLYLDNVLQVKTYPYIRQNRRKPLGKAAVGEAMDDLGDSLAVWPKSG